MAPRIKAINAYRPRVEQGNTVQKPELIRALSRATGLVEGSIDQATKELRDQIIESTAQAAPSKWKVSEPSLSTSVLILH